MERLVTEITKKDQKRSLVRFADGTALPLYQGEIRRYHLKEGEAVSEETWKKLWETLRHRVKERSLYLLDKADRTESELREKLRQGSYPVELIESAVSDAVFYGFIDDARYARMYIQQKSGKKSIKEMRQYLLGKRISRDIIQEAFQETGATETDALRRMAERKAAQVKPQTPADWQKVMRYLAGHGYLYEEIHGVLDELRSNDHCE